MQNTHPIQSAPSAGEGGAVLVCVGPGPGAARAIEHGARLAAAGGVPWHAVLVETPRTRRLPEAMRLAALERLRQARAQGALTAVLDGDDAAAAIAAYARRHACATLVVTRNRRLPWPWSAPMARRLARLAPRLDVLEVAAPDTHAGTAPAAVRAARHGAPEPREARRYLAALGASLGTALVALPLLPLLDVANVAMLFLLCVVLVAIRLGRGPAVAATLAGFAALVLAVPRRAYDLSEFKYAVALSVMLAVGWITARLTADLREQAEAATGREARTRALYEFARALSVALQMEQVFEITRKFVARSFDTQGTILLPGPDGRLAWPGHGALNVMDMAAAQWAFEHGEAAGAGSATLPNNDYVYLPLLAPMRNRGVLAIRVRTVDEQRLLLVPERRELLDAFAALAAIALERVHYVDVAQEAVVSMEGERLRNSLLAALSHDLRTPLTGLVGLSESLTLSRPSLDAAQMELACALRDEARRMSTLVANLLDMARIQSGGVKLNLQWQFVEEAVGAALRACRWQLGSRGVRTRIPRDLPLVRFDAALIERVLCNLLENAAKYTPAAACIEIAADAADGMLRLCVCDDGPGLPAGREDALFEKFVRGQQESPIAGVGLGLAICRAIVEAHGGRMRAFNRDGGGACFELALPLGEPPALPVPDLDDHHLQESTAKNE